MRNWLFFETRESYQQYLNKYERYQKCNEKVNQSVNKIKEIEGNINQLFIKMRKTEIALEEINDNLAKIFYDNNRLLLESTKDKYLVKSRGKYIKLKDLSVGEQNVIGLCYFFSIINKNQTTSNAFKQPLLIVLDDPISSFDRENKIGVYNFLRKYFNRIESGNEKSKIIVLSHDMEVVLNIEKIFTEIPKKEGPNLKILDKNGLQNDIKRHNKNQYTRNINEIYQFACGNKKELTDFIGNIMRKVLEAFTTFNYRCGINDERLREEIGKKVKNEKEKDFFENFMFRLVLNNESHMNDIITNSTDISSYYHDYLTEEEKLYTSKSLILLLYRLNSSHVEAYIDKFDKHKVENWNLNL